MKIYLKRGNEIGLWTGTQKRIVPLLKLNIPRDGNIRCHRYFSAGAKVVDLPAAQKISLIGLPAEHQLCLPPGIEPVSRPALAAPPIPAYPASHKVAVIGVTRQKTTV